MAHYFFKCDKCDQCPYVTGYASSLNMHTKMYHVCHTYTCTSATRGTFIKETEVGVDLEGYGLVYHDDGDDPDELQIVKIDIDLCLIDEQPSVPMSRDLFKCEKYDQCPYVTGYSST